MLPHLIKKLESNFGYQASGVQCHGNPGTSQFRNVHPSDKGKIKSAYQLNYGLVWGCFLSWKAFKPSPDLADIFC
jgi:hypothetical protein